ncbi:MAG: hypothetical protein ACOYVJ_02550, partial [Nitrospirota bacterium]
YYYLYRPGKKQAMISRHKKPHNLQDQEPLQNNMAIFSISLRLLIPLKGGTEKSAVPRISLAM